MAAYEVTLTDGKKAHRFSGRLLVAALEFTAYDGYVLVSFYVSRANAVTAQRRLAKRWKTIVLHETTSRRYGRKTKFVGAPRDGRP